MKDKRIVPIIVMAAAFIAVTVFHINVVFVILVCGMIGFLSAIKTAGKDEGHDPS